MSTAREHRTGHGSWCTILTPCAGILWTNGDTVGFEPVLGDVDPEPINQQIQANTDAGLPPPESFALLASLIGRNLTTGQLDTWTPDRQRHRPDLGPEPTMTTTTEVMAALGE